MDAWSGPDLLTLAQSRATPYGRHRRLLWPAWKYRVHAPVVADEQMNVFQRAVLRLCRAGVRRTDDLTRLLRLEDSALCAEVLAEMREREYLTEEHELTRFGTEALLSGELDPLETTVAYVFQDPFTEEVWPNAVERLRPAEIDWSNRDRPVLRSGDAGDPRPAEVCLPVRPPGDERPSPPEAIDVLEAIRALRTSRREVERTHGALPSERLVRRLSFVDSEPEPVFLMTFLYTSHGGKDSPNEFPWWARDPLTDVASVMLRRIVAARCEHDETLRAEVDRLTGAEKAKKLRRLARDEADVARRVTEELERRFTLRIHEDEELFQLVSTVETNYQKGITGGGASAFETALRTSFRIFEYVFRGLVRQYLSKEDRTLLTANGPGKNHDSDNYFQKLIRETASSLGLADARSVAADRRNLSRRLATAVKKPKGADFPATFAVAVLSARGRPDHPLRAFAALRPKLFEELTEMSRLRNPVSHAELDAPERDEVEWCRQVVQALIPAILGTLVTH